MSRYADARAIALDLDLGQSGFAQKLREFADRLRIDIGLAFRAIAVCQACSDRFHVVQTVCYSICASASTAKR
jgi:hypothetical protein